MSLKALKQRISAAAPHERAKPEFGAHIGAAAELLTDKERDELARHIGAQPSPNEAEVAAQIERN